MGIYDKPQKLTELYSIDSFLPDTAFVMHPELPMPHMVTESARAVVGLTLNLAARSVTAKRLAGLTATGSLNVQVLLVPQHDARPGNPVQYSRAGATLGLAIGEDTLTVSGSRAANSSIGNWEAGETTTQIRFAKQETQAGTLWRPDQAAGLSVFRLYGVDAVPTDGAIDAHNSGVFDRLARASSHLGSVVAWDVHERVASGDWAPQVLLDGQLVGPAAPDAAS